MIILLLHPCPFALSLSKGALVVSLPNHERPEAVTRDSQKTMGMPGLFVDTYGSRWYISSYPVWSLRIA